jgi:O-antigen ligase
MNSDSHKIFAAGGLLLAVAALLLAIVQPEYLGSYFYLGALIFVEVMLLALWDYPRRFFALLLGVFLWAGIDLPLNEAWLTRRWIVLGIAAGAGFVFYLRQRRHHFGLVHLVALFCVLGAMVSATISAFPRVAMLKALSLFLLFAYAATGARLALQDREGRFFAGLLAGCELLVYVGAVSYFIFRHELFGNPNSLGAIMGIAVVPVLLWGVLASDRGALRRRRSAALVLALGLLFSSYSRASIGAAAISCVLLCLVLREYRLLARGAALALVLAVLVAAVRPLKTNQPDTVVGRFLYKGEVEVGVFGSRRSVWEQTVDSIRQHPWFGTGFGTVATSYDSTVRQPGTFASSRVSTREHGTSYLAITEWVGLLGVPPFLLLILLVAAKAGNVMLWLRRTRDPLVPAAPLAAVVIAGLAHAAFEDWMFAVGYYMCVFFWSVAFMLFDAAPETAHWVVRPGTRARTVGWHEQADAAVARR